MTTEICMPIVDAPADPAVESAALKEIDEQPSTQLESASVLSSGAPAPVDPVAIEAMPQVQDEEHSTGETPAKEGNFALADVIDSDVAKTQSLPVDNSDNSKGAWRALYLIAVNKPRAYVSSLCCSCRSSCRGIQGICRSCCQCTCNAIKERG